MEIYSQIYKLSKIYIIYDFVLCNNPILLLWIFVNRGRTGDAIQFSDCCTLPLPVVYCSVPTGGAVLTSWTWWIYLFYLIGVLHRFQHCTGHIMMGSFVGRGNHYIQLVKVLYCKLLTNRKQLPAFPLEVRPGTEPQSQR